MGYAFNAIAADTLAEQYQIEIIVFSYHNHDANTPPLELAPYLATSIDKVLQAHNYDDTANAPTTTPIIKTNTPDYLKLTQQHTRLAQHYTVLIHSSWIEDTAVLKKGISLGIDSTHLYGDWQEENLNQPAESVYGRIHLSLNRYFDTQAELTLAKDTAPQQQVLAFLKHKRRLRSMQLHYIDNPQFGVLLQISPIATTNDTKINQDSTDTTLWAE